MIPLSQQQPSPADTYQGQHHARTVDIHYTENKSGFVVDMIFGFELGEKIGIASAGVEVLLGHFLGWSLGIGVARPTQNRKELQRVTDGDI